jgi:hypothetical protein
VLGWLTPDPEPGGAKEKRSMVGRPSSKSEPLPPPSITGNEVKMAASSTGHGGSGRGSESGGGEGARRRRGIPEEES